MGFFSWNCKRCGLAIMSPYQVEDETRWLNKCVFILPDGDIHKGSYGGYGDVGSCENIYELGEPEAYHEACWNLAGRPVEFTSASESARNQGYFICEDDPEWTATEPTE